MLNLIDKGSDYNCLKSLSKQGLVQKEVTVQGKHGTYIRKQWVSAGRQSGQREVKPVKNTSEERPKKPKTLYFPLSDCGNTRTKAFTYSDIMTYYSKHKSEIKTSIDKYIKSHYFISDGRSQTQDLYKTHRGYTTERQKLHNTIIQGILDSANSPKNGEKPIAVLMGGGSASGKGTLRSALVIPRLQSEGIYVAKMVGKNCPYIGNDKYSYTSYTAADKDTKGRADGVLIVCDTVFGKYGEFNDSITAQRNNKNEGGTYDSVAVGAGALMPGGGAVKEYECIVTRQNMVAPRYLVDCGARRR